jgi:menaquinone-dependent protoporphyrinogen oxidase
MVPVQIHVATRDGQSERIARHVAARLESRGVAAEVDVLEAPPPHAPTIAQSPLIVLIAAVRYGRHLPEAEAFLADYSGRAVRPPLALASVNLTARKPDRRSVQENGYLRKLIARYRLTPIVACAIGGRLDYPRYRWVDRQMIRLIMAMTGGPTDGTSTIEYTQWDQVDAFADQIVACVGRSAPSPAVAPN